jgi:hypothetical protein
MNYRLYISFLVMLVPFLSVAQTNVFEIFKSERKIAESYYKKKDYHTALLIYNTILKKNTRDTSILLHSARANKRVGYYQESYAIYSNIKDTSIFTPEDKLNMGELLMILDKTEEANQWLRAYSAVRPTDMRIQNKLQKLNTRDILIEDSLSYTVISAPFNSEHSEFYPVQMDQDLVFLSNQPVFSHIKIVNSDNSYFFEIYRAPESTSKTEFELYHKNLSGKFHVGPFCFMDNGNTLILTLTDSRTKKLKLCFAHKKSGNNAWRISGSFPYNSKKYSVGHPFFSEQDSVLYFVSDMEGSIGGTDIFRCRLKNGKWEAPENIGRPVNSEGNEMFPYVHKGKFYFASDGHRGLGGLDIFHTELDNGVISENLTNCGLPVNSEGDDFAIFYCSSRKGYFSSNRPGGKGKDDIYSFVCLNSTATAKVTEFNGTPLNGVRVAITENNKKVVKDVITGANGSVNFEIKPGKTYSVHFEKNGYKPVDSIFSTSSEIKSDHLVTAKLERKNKAFIKGTVRYNGKQPVVSGKVKVVNQKTSHIDTTSFNANGEFFAQVDPDYTYIFYAGNDSLLGLKYVENLPRKKGSFVSMVDISVDRYTEKEIHLTVMDSVTGKPLDNAYVNIFNSSTGEKIVKETDKNGNLKMRVVDRFDYEIAAECNELQSEKLIITGKETKDEFFLIIK